MTTALIVDLPHMAKAAQQGQRRIVYFEASRDDGSEDREGESVAVEGLWKSRDLFLSQGDLDIAHWGHLPSPLTGMPQPEYRIGLPDTVKREGDGIFVRGEIFSSRTPAPADSSGIWADRWWHSVTGLTPPDRWFPSVYGDIHPGGLEVSEDKRGVVRRRIVSVDWFSVGFARRAMHANLPAVSLSPMGGLEAMTDVGGDLLMAKADNRAVQLAAQRVGALHLGWRQLAKAMTVGLPMSKAMAEVGMPQTDHANLSGVQALRGESLDEKPRKKPSRKYLAARLAVLRKLNKGELNLTKGALCKAFEALGYGQREGMRLWHEIHAG
jgi:hypothetical protein